MLRTLLSEARWSGARLAREVNAEASAQGLTLSYDRTAVSHWLSGTRPRPPAAEFAAEVLSRRLGRSVGALDTGLVPSSTQSHGNAAPREGESPMDILERLGVPADRRDAARTGVFSLAALLLPVWDSWPPGATQSVRTEARSVPDAEAAGLLLSLFSQHDAAFGGGQVRAPLRAYLATTMTAWLRQPASPRDRSELLTVAHQLTYLCAFAHFDANMQAHAQQYYLTGIQLAREAGDRVGFALAARGLSVQALALGHLREADRLAGLAVDVGLPSAPAHQQAFLLGNLAVTQAHLGDPRAAARHLIHAEKRLDAADGSATPVGAFHPSSLALQHAAVARAQADHKREAQHLQSSLRGRPHQENRARTISLADLAEAQLNAGHLDQACRTWTAFLDLYENVCSARADDRLRTLIARLRSHAAHAGVPALLARAVPMATSRPGG
jgi:tetratricopeptide (TPR) repeat protein